MQKTLSISELAKRAGVTSKTLRHWERLGLLPKAMRTHTGYRVENLLKLGRSSTALSGCQVCLIIGRTERFQYEKQTASYPSTNCRVFFFPPRF